MKKKEDGIVGNIYILCIFVLSVREMDVTNASAAVNGVGEA